MSMIQCGVPRTSLVSVWCVSLFRCDLDRVVMTFAASICCLLYGFVLLNLRPCQVGENDGS